MVIQSNTSASAFAIREARAGYLIELWLISAVGAIIAIRGYLALTGYPQVGGGNLHIAHMLWGGLLLTVALGTLLIFASGVWKPIAAVVGGIGFGTFIDELGKFITADNDYFYQPTIALIYLIFIGIFLVARAIARGGTVTEKKHLFSAVVALEQLAVGRLDDAGRREALRHIDASGDRSAFASGIREALVAAPVLQPKPSRFSRWWRTGVTWYRRVAGTRWFERLLLALFLFQAVLFIGTLAALVATRNLTIANGLSFFEWGALLSSFAGEMLVLIGVVHLVRGARLEALHWFASSVLVSIFFAQFFAFAAEQLAALGGLTVQLLLHGSLRASIAAEQKTS